MSHADANHYYELSSASVPVPLRQHPRHSSEDVSLTLDKREQASEKQRRKRQRDRTCSMILNPGGTSDANLDSRDQELGGTASVITRGKGGGKRASLDNLPLEEAQRKQRIREAARERQRKHRAGVKARRMAELGMAIVNEGGGIEQTAIGYTINEQGQYEAVLADPSDPNQHTPVPPSFPVPQPHATAGQMFASTLLLGLSCTPHLKQQLLHTLRSTNEDLATFEPFMAGAFDHWDNGRSMHYAAQGHHIPSTHMPTQPAPYAQPYPPANERFQRPLAAFPTSPLHGRHESFSPSEESHHADGDSDTQGEPELSHPQHHVRSHPSREPRAGTACTNGVRDGNDEEG